MLINPDEIYPPLGTSLKDEINSIYWRRRIYMGSPDAIENLADSLVNTTLEYVKDPDDAEKVVSAVCQAALTTYKV